MTNKYLQQPITSSLSRSHLPITPFANSLIKKLSHRLTLSCFLMLFSCFSYAQDTNGWQWAKSGGGNVGADNELAGAYSFTSEQILDIKIDEGNNYYFLAKITQGSPHIDDVTVETYNKPTSINSRTDIALFSTTSDGNLRWYQIIGGGGVVSDKAYSIVLDNDNGIYLTPIVGSVPTSDITALPIHFGEEVILPKTTADNTAFQEGFKSGFLLKYNRTDGTFVWRKDIQGDVNFYNKSIFIHKLIIDSSNTIHTIVGLMEGSHLDDLIEVPVTTPAEYTYYLVKFDTDGDILETPIQLPFNGGFVEGKYTFRYDENLNRYYFAGGRGENGSVTDYRALSYNNNAFEYAAYILVIDGETGEELWRKEMSATNGAFDGRIYDLEIDEDSEVYIGGTFFNSGSNPGVSFNSYPLSNELIGYVPFILKMNSSGEILWHKVPDGNTNSLFGETVTQQVYDLAINGNEVALATESAYHIWGDFQINRSPVGMSGHGTDPVLVRFNKETGTVVGLNDIMGTPGGNDALTSVAVDNEGAYVVGGYIRGGLFTDNPNGVETIYNAQGQNNSYTDFFYAKLLVDTVASTEEFNSIAINVFPNPTTDIVYFETDEKLITYSVFNENAQQVQVQTQINETNYQMSLDGLASGTYFILLKTETGKSTTVKVVKE